MYTEGFDQLSKLNKSFSAPLADITRLTTEMYRRSTQQNLELIGENMLLFSDQLKKITAVKRPEDFLNLQKNFLNESMTVGAATVQKWMNTFLENMSACAELCSSIQNPMMNTALKTTEEIMQKAAKVSGTKTGSKKTKRKK